MTDAPESVWLDRDMQPWRVWTIEMSDLPRYVPAERMAALEAENARLRAGPKVKPLVWEEGDRNGGFYASVPIKNMMTGYYQITQEEFGLATVEFGIHCHEFGCDVVWKGPSADAKAAAQADHEARILSALEAPE